VWSKDKILGLWTNLQGWRTKERLVVVESDDWGSIRMPSRKVRQALIRNGIIQDDNRFDLFDCLESGDDLDALFSVLSNHSDMRGQPAKITFNTVMGNPDFDAIRDDNFEQFRLEHFFDSYRRYHSCDLSKTWQSGIDQRLIRPQFHAREHLNSLLWLRDLRGVRKDIRTAFDYGFFGTRCGTSSNQKNNYLAAYWAENTTELNQMIKIARDGMKIFESTFGFESRSFIACNHIAPVELEIALGGSGVRLIQGQRSHVVPDVNYGGKLKRKRRYTGQLNQCGQFHAVRNVQFEPFLDLNRDWVTTALGQVRQAFKFNRPAVVSSHRVNFVGGMDKKHRDGNLKMMDRLLRGIRITWPDVQFISSDELATKLYSRFCSNSWGGAESEN
jgi:hypothetical protein